MKPKVLLLRTAGTNCDEETAFAFNRAGAEVISVHIATLKAKPALLHESDIFVIPGGFTYGDDIFSGRILANELRFFLAGDLLRFIRDGKLMLGICNGFQVLVRAGLLPDVTLQPSGAMRQTASLAHNDSGRFEDRWVRLRVTPSSSPWLSGLPESIELPVAHAEGKFVPLNRSVFAQWRRKGQIVLTYVGAEGKEPVYPENPNGSIGHVAGVTDASGRILGMMPHPERFFFQHHHPDWPGRKTAFERGDGALIFFNGVRYILDRRNNRERLVHRETDSKSIGVGV